MGTRHQSARRSAAIVGAVLAILCLESSGVHTEELRSPERFIRDLRDHLLEQAYRTSYAAGDFNGDGFGDLAIGIPYATVAGKRAAGKVIVINGDHHGLTDIAAVYYQGAKGRYGLPHANEAGDLVGFSLAAGDFNGDGIADLAVGAPGQDLTRDDGVTYVDAGAIFVAHGEVALGLNFLVPGGMYVQDGRDRPPQFDLAGDMSPGSLLGFSLAAGNFDGDAWTDLAIGLPGKAYLVPGSKESRENAGAMVVVAGTAAGLWGRGAAQLFSQGEFSTRANDNYNLSGGARTGDCVGFSLAAGDFDGDGRDDLAIGAPGQNDEIGGVEFKNAGAVKLAKGTPDGLDARAYPASYGASGEGRLNLAGEAQDGALLGFSLAAGDFDGDGRDDLAVGVPGRRIGRSEYAGAVVVAAGADEGQDGAPGPDGEAYVAEFTQSANDAAYDLPGSARSYALVGFSLAAGDFDFSTLSRLSDLAIGAPGIGVMVGSVSPELSAGAVLVRFGSADAGIASAWRQMMLSQTGGQHEDLWDDAEEGDNVGMSVAAGHIGAGGAADLMISAPGERFPNLTLGEPLDAPYDQMFVDGMTHVVYGQEGVGLDGGVGEYRWFPRFTRGAQIDPHHVQFDLFPEVMQETQPIVSEDWSLWYSYVELLLKPWTDPALGTADELYTRTQYVHHGGRELGPRRREVQGFGVFVIDGTGLLLVVDAYYEDFGHHRAVRFLPMFPNLALWAEPVQVILLPNYAVEVIVEP